jgi:hypothetical protein
LVKIGYRIDGLRGSAGGYRLAPGTRMPPLLLDDADVIAITASLLTTRPAASPAWMRTPNAPSPSWIT